MLPDSKARFDRFDRNRAGGDPDRKLIDALVAAAMVHAEAVGELQRGMEPLVGFV